MAHLPCYINTLRIVLCIFGLSEDSAYTWILVVEPYIGQRLLHSLLSEAKGLIRSNTPARERGAWWLAAEVHLRPI